ncbi:MAG TPA: DUF1109 domain-containing protein [Accumulibacter sp.]|nr:DUF1109 domain-containing protein [Accumulibacter sp.]
MNTDELVAFLATGVEPVAASATDRRHAVALAGGGVGAMSLMLVLLGVRGDLLAAMHLPMFWVKLALPVGIALGALTAAKRLARPGVVLGWLPAALLLAPVVGIGLLAALALSAAAPEARLALLLGRTWAVCPLLIALLSLPVFAGTFWAMNGLAPTRPALAGAAAGLLAGAVATAIYALHCPEMAAPFLATWYLVGMAIPTAVGALLGPRLLRW